MATRLMIETLLKEQAPIIWGEFKKEIPKQADGLLTDDVKRYMREMFFPSDKWDPKKFELEMMKLPFNRQTDFKVGENFYKVDWGTCKVHEMIQRPQEQGGWKAFGGGAVLGLGIGYIIWGSGGAA